MFEILKDFALQLKTNVPTCIWGVLMKFRWCLKLVNSTRAAETNLFIEATAFNE